MHSWNRPQVPRVPGTGPVPTLFDTATGSLVSAPGTPTATLYVCGITPYDATHLGHAATYLAFDTLVRTWLDADIPVVYAQNTTDVDDPLLERATATGVDWRELAASQTDLFRGDMAALSIIPPDHFVAVTEMVDEIADAVAELVSRGFAYEVPASDSLGAVPDLYFDSAAADADTAWSWGAESRLDRETMLTLSAERGGDPDRAGKRDRLDPLLWRAAREGEPQWSTALGAGRPGWHIECSVIATRHLGDTITVQGGGSDLVFPHHEFSAAHATALSGATFARIFSHAGMVGFDGEKMSKSLGNLVLVSRLTAAGVDARAIRLALLDHHYRADAEWTDDVLARGTGRLDRWREWASTADATTASEPDDLVTDDLVAGIRAALADDLDTPAALRAVDSAVDSGAPATRMSVTAIHALLGVDLTA
ncbi:cysteine--1-D-myo-inosityl 2-amino-2-deoxy-alpha-D-glucopyranoside ligase [Marisediminicola sp. LYQ85]|uniref:cysteine--1-D-myo-inosityl 2-amino-2-deoxy-alpha-D-glucopyranoside ligase n=1 Tax=Marisediminicola sp. LYQ85 TaxID=3391062 RepID=UPI00398306BA